MKNYFLPLLLVLLFFSSSPNLNANTPTNSSCESIQTTSYNSYIYFSGNWHTGKIWIQQTQNGYKLLSYNFDSVHNVNGHKLSGDFDQRHSLTKLNPNNELAKQNNFTHYVTIQGLKAYLILD